MEKEKENNNYNVKEGMNNPIKVSSKTADELDNEIEIENMKKIEAALFLSAKFLSMEELVMLTDINPLMLRELLEKLIQKYNGSNSAIEIVIKNNLWKMDIGSEYISMVNKIATGSSEFSKAEQETLAVIAYKQPVKQSVIIKIRGNKAYEHIKHFIDIGLLHAKKAGHTKELNLRDDFFNYFHLQKKSEKSVDFEASESENAEEVEESEVEDVESEEVEDEEEESKETNEDKESENEIEKEMKEEIKKDKVREEVIEEKEEAEINEGNIENEINNENNLEGR